MFKQALFISTTALIICVASGACESPTGPTNILEVVPSAAYLQVGDSIILTIEGGHFQNSYYFTPDISSMTCCRVEDVGRGQIKVAYLQSIYINPKLLLLNPSPNYYSTTLKVSSGNSGSKSQNTEAKIYFTN